MFFVRVHYQADTEYIVDAETPEEAEKIAMRLAGQTAPYDQLVYEVAYVDEIPEEK
jgi:hypothetical protein